jgi:hypothetical protein
VGRGPKVHTIESRGARSKGNGVEMLGWILLILLILLVLGLIPTWPYSRQWGYAPSGIAGVLLVIVIILLLMGVF